MGRRLRTVRGWLAPHNDARAHLIFLINAAVALSTGFLAVADGHVSIGVGLAITAAAFVGLTACLLSRKTALIAAVLGAGLAGLVAGTWAWASFTGRAAADLAGGASGAFVFALVFFVYLRFVRATTGAGELEGRFRGTFNERDEQRRKGSGAATVVVSATDEGDHDLRVTGLVVGGLAVDFFGARREEQTIADLRTGSVPASRFELLRGKISIHGSSLIVDLEGSPFGSYVFTGHRARD